MLSHVHLVKQNNEIVFFSLDLLFCIFGPSFREQMDIQNPVSLQDVFQK